MHGERFLGECDACACTAVVSVNKEPGGSLRSTNSRKCWKAAGVADTSKWQETEVSRGLGGKGSGNFLWRLVAL